MLGFFFLFLTLCNYIHGDKSPESKQISSFKLGHARRKCQAGEKQIKIKLIKNTK